MKVFPHGNGGDQLLKAAAKIRVISPFAIAVLITRQRGRRLSDSSPVML
jgi:hypothetical protein